MITFSKILNELIKENELSIQDLGEAIKLKDCSLIYDWLSESCYPSFANLVALADFFQCSIDYLIGRTENYELRNYKDIQPFDIQLKMIMKEKQISQYQMIFNDKICSPNHFNRWFKTKNQPQLETLIKLADYFNITIDYLVGRE